MIVCYTSRFQTTLIAYETHAELDVYASIIGLIDSRNLEIPNIKLQRGRPAHQEPWLDQLPKQ